MYTAPDGNSYWFYDHTFQLRKYTMNHCVTSYDLYQMSEGYHVNPFILLLFTTDNAISIQRKPKPV